VRGREDEDRRYIRKREAKEKSNYTRKDANKLSKL